MPGRASTAVMDLCPCIRERFRAFKENAKAECIDVALIETLRDLDRQRYYVDHGVSQTLNSYHLPHEPNGLSLAFDVCPREYLALKDWNPGGPFWFRIADIGRRLGLGWGGDWTGFVDRAHFQLERCACPPKEAA